MLVYQPMKTIKLLSLMGLSLFQINQWSVHPKENLVMLDSAMDQLSNTETSVNIPAMYAKYKAPRVYWVDDEGNEVEKTINAEDLALAQDPKAGKDGKGAWR